MSTPPTCSKVPAPVATTSLIAGPMQLGARLGVAVRPTTGLDHHHERAGVDDGITLSLGEGYRGVARGWAHARAPLSRRAFELRKFQAPRRASAGGRAPGGGRRGAARLPA